VSSKKISFNIPAEDIRPLTSSTLGLVIGRLSKKFQNNVNNLNEACKESDSLEILTKVQQLIEGLEESISELNELGNLIEEVPSIEPKVEE
jgi:hypothetical protein